MDIKKDNFNRISATRVSKIIESISKLKNLSNKSFYEYDEQQIKEIFCKIQEELDKQKEYFEIEMNKPAKREEM